MNKTEAVKTLKTIEGFFGTHELESIKDGMRGEEQQYFFDKIEEVAAIIKTIPKLYAQDGKGDNAIVYLHYFIGNADWFVTEVTKGRAFGYADLGLGFPELGYVMISELTQNQVELDLHFKPKPLGEVKKGRVN